MENKRKIQECIFNIDMICRSLFLSIRDVIELKIPNKSVVYSDMVRYQYIQLCSILDEITILNGIAKNDKYLKDTLYVISPARRAIEKYSGIRKARNVMLAHFNRDSRKNFEPWWLALKGLKLPESKNDISLIFVWLQIINSIFVTRYYQELKEISLELKPDLDNYYVWAKSDLDKTIQLSKNLKAVYHETEKKAEEIGLNELKMEPLMADFIK